MNFIKNLIEKIKGFPKKTKIYFTIWSIINVLIFFLYIFGAGANILIALLFFVMWQGAVTFYYYYRYYIKKDRKYGEWFDAIMFAILAATFIRSLFIEAYQIPTPSMEKSLLVGDFLFVSKVNYGARLPMTPLSVPFAHQTLPIIETKAYSSALQLPYFRLPGFQTIKNGDVVVFNYPFEPDNPVDKKTNYIKRCIAISGDELSIVNGQIYLNGKKFDDPAGRQYSYTVNTEGNTGLNKKLLNELDITYSVPERSIYFMTDKTRELIRKENNISKIDTLIQRADSAEDQTYPMWVGMAPPNWYGFRWSRDNFGPIYVPQKGHKIEMNEKNYYLYKMPIEQYEHAGTLELSGDKVTLNGKPITEYTFKMNYYFMMGDNRHNSQDSRYWGFVPEDHIVGKALFVWLSLKYDVKTVRKRNGDFVDEQSFKGVRWNRIFMGIK
jgi:signal peptidase I